MSVKNFVASAVAWVKHILFPYRFRKKWEEARVSIRSRWLSYEFKEAGKGLTFMGIGDLRGAEYIRIGDHSGFGPGLFLTAWDEYEGRECTPNIEIGCNCNFGAWNHITAINKIQIGDGCMTGKWVTITDNAHGDMSEGMLEMMPVTRPLVSKGPVVIGRNVWIGDKATILPGVVIGDGAIVAANAVVTSDVPARSIVAGVTARVVRKIE